MKYLNILLVTILVFTFSCGKKIPSTAIKQSFHVSGNCGMCKKKIESSCDVPGIYKANWNKKTKMITVVFDTTVISLSEIQQGIAKAGYDNDGFRALDDDYNNLHSCCKYERDQ